MTIQTAKQILALHKIEKRRKDEVMRFMTTGKVHSDELQREIDGFKEVYDSGFKYGVKGGK